MVWKRIELPILVYEEDGQWIAESLLTGTIHVAEGPEEASERCMELLVLELQDAFSGSPNFDEAWSSLAVSPDPELLSRWFRADPIHKERPKRPPQPTAPLPRLSIRPRKVALSTAG